MAIFSLKQKIFIVKRYYQTGNSTKSVQIEFPSVFNSQSDPLSCDSIIELVNLFEEFGTVYPNTVKHDLVLENDSREEEFEIKIEPFISTYNNDGFDHNTQPQSGEGAEDENNKLDTRLARLPEDHEFNDDIKIAHTIKLDVINEYIEKDLSKLILKCKICHKEFDKEMYLNRHIKSHGKTCEICGKKYQNRENHMKKHSGEKSFQCTECGARFINMSRLNNHMTSHSEERPFACITCQKKFKSRERLRVHQKTHNTDRPNKCEVCGKGFLQKYDLKKHLNVHTGERKSICSICGKCFVSNDSLKIHMRCHTGEKPYSCRYCEKNFSSAGVLKIHERIHTGEKPYKCKYCDKEFYDSSTRRAHERTHTGDYPYKCTLCGKAHNHPSNLKSHMRHAHREEQLTNFK